MPRFRPTKNSATAYPEPLSQPSAQLFYPLDWEKIPERTAERMTAVDHLFFFSRFACFFSLAVFWGCFFLSFFVSCDLDMSLTSL
jgi:hypothetical protein